MNESLLLLSFICILIRPDQFNTGEDMILSTSIWTISIYIEQCIRGSHITVKSEANYNYITSFDFSGIPRKENIITPSELSIFPRYSIETIWPFPRRDHCLSHICSSFSSSFLHQFSILVAESTEQSQTSFITSAGPSSKQKVAIQMDQTHSKLAATAPWIPIKRKPKGEGKKNQQINHTRLVD